MQTSLQTCLANHVERISKLLELYLVQAFREDVGNLLIRLCRHHINLSLKDLFFLCSGNELLYVWSLHGKLDFLQ
jgi:hypothetical protein